jgi:hypothetical protein
VEKIISARDNFRRSLKLENRKAGKGSRIGVLLHNEVSVGMRACSDTAAARGND